MAVITYLTSRPRLRAEVRKLEAESDRTMAETTKILSEFQARPSNVAGNNALPRGWYVTGARPEDYEFGVDTQVFHSGHASAFIQSRPGAKEFASIAQVFKADAYRGKRVRLSAMLKTRDVANWAGLWLRIDDVLHNVMEFDNTADRRSISGTQSWSRRNVVLDVPGDGATIRIGFLLNGDGRVWCDDMKFEEVGLDIPVTRNIEGVRNHPENLDFEAGTN
ncbi:hypothetical protein [Streptomyces sp. NRRL S-646]|uniref:hypothetical protein n=1 Tax=Streptomyces sp. NRRL S-646 TaxID=1463917 RepID=UPI001331A870|nr:hypothetical protein [Streptomyces sp. NRRL S-646]